MLSQLEQMEFKSDIVDNENSLEDHNALQQKIHILQRDQELLHSNIAKLTDENTQLKAQLSVTSLSQTPLFRELSVFQEIEQLQKEELSRVYALLDRGKDLVVVDTSRLHQEKMALILRFEQSERDSVIFAIFELVLVAFRNCFHIERLPLKRLSFFDG